MESGFQISVPLKTGTKKIRKRRELDALVSYSNSKRGNINRSVNTNGKNTLEKLIRTSTDEQEEYDLEKDNQKLEKRRVRNCISIRIFVPIIIVVLLFCFVNWLIFDLKQQFIAYRQKIEEVSVICQILPEEMQKWHEKSSLLEKNQSTIYEKINEIQISIENLRNNFTKFAARADVQSKYTKEDKFVADLGAKLEDVANDMAVIKNHFTVLQNTNTKFDESINKLETRFSEISDHIPEKNKDEEVCLEKIQNLQTKYEDEIKGVTANISTVNDTLTQKAHILSEELSTHKSKLDDLFDKSANITSHVTSIENDWTKYRQQIIDSATKIDNFDNKMYDVANKTSNFEKTLQKVLLYYTPNNTIGTSINNSTEALAEQTTTLNDQTKNNKTGD